MRLRLYISNTPVTEESVNDQKEMWEVIAKWKQEYLLRPSTHYHIYLYEYSNETPEREDRSGYYRESREKKKCQPYDLQRIRVTDIRHFEKQKPDPKAYVFNTPRDI